MRLRIAHKLFLSLLITSGVSLIVLMLLFRWSLDRGFVAYLNQLELERQTSLVASLQQIYVDHGGWDVLRERPGFWRDLLEASRNRVDVDDHRAPRRPPPREPQDARVPPFHPERQGPPGPRPRPPGEGDNLRITLFDVNQTAVIGPSKWDDEQSKLEIIVDHQTVGWLGIRPFLEVTEALDVAFLKEQTRFALFCFCALILLAMVVSAFLARHFNAPIRTLAKASHQLTEGKFDVRIASEGSDEIAQLARDFDQMAQVLDKNRKARQIWISDISHELRTPLTILTGELDAVSDGVRPLNPQTMVSIRQEVERLEKMVNDLYDLSLSDIGALDYHKTYVSLVEVLNTCVTTHRDRFEKKGIDLQWEHTGGDATLLMDANRMNQLISNLFENSLRYTDSPGTLHCTLTVTPSTLVAVFEDSAPGVSAQECELLFERLYRVDKSRSRRYGGAGLGLAICKNIVEGHGGKIHARPSVMGGLKVTVEFPKQGSGDAVS
ncbi:MAG: HAMP domain-containing protein [Acidobacteria bacterium]|nr:HAMP domain-containing protein [Acidobacteriota bacterium]